MSWNTSNFIESINSLLTIMSSFDIDSDEAGEAYISIREDLASIINENELDIVFEMLVYALTLSTLSLHSGCDSFQTFWQKYLLSLDKASDKFLLSSFGDVEAIMPKLHAIMLGMQEAEDPALWDEDEE